MTENTYTPLWVTMTKAAYKAQYKRLDSGENVGRNDFIPYAKRAISEYQETGLVQHIVNAFKYASHTGCMGERRCLLKIAEMASTEKLHSWSIVQGTCKYKDVDEVRPVFTVEQLQEQFEKLVIAMDVARQQSIDDKAKLTKAEVAQKAVDSREKSICNGTKSTEEIQSYPAMSLQQLRNIETTYSTKLTAVRAEIKTMLQTIESEALAEQQESDQPETAEATG